MSIDLSAAGSFSLIKGQENSYRGVHRGSQIHDRHADFRWFVRIARRGNDSGLALDQQVVGFYVPVGAVLAVAGHGTINQARIARTELRRSQTQAIGNPGRKILEDYIHRSARRRTLPAPPAS